MRFFAILLSLMIGMTASADLSFETQMQALDSMWKQALSNHKDNFNYDKLAATRVDLTRRARVTMEAEVARITKTHQASTSDPKDPVNERKNALIEKAKRAEWDFVLNTSSDLTAALENNIEQTRCQGHLLYLNLDCFKKLDRYRSSPFNFQKREIKCSGVAHSGNKYELKFTFEYPVDLYESIVPARNVKIEVNRFNPENTRVNRREVVEHQTMAFHNMSGGFLMSDIHGITTSEGDNVNAFAPRAGRDGANFDGLTINVGRIRGVELNRASCDYDITQFNTPMSMFGSSGGTISTGPEDSVDSAASE